MAAHIEIASTVDDDLVATVARILPLLSSSAPPSAEHLRAIVEGPDTDLFVARVDGRIVGILTLAMYRIPTGNRAWIEDVIVDEAARGRGIGEALTKKALDLAQAAGARTVDLTTRPHREAAGRLYERVGFAARTTRNYRYTFARSAS